MEARRYGIKEKMWFATSNFLTYLLMEASTPRAFGVYAYLLQGTCEAPICNPNPDKLVGISILTIEADSEQRETFELFISIAFLNFLSFFARK
jgi:hypothetical protein